MKAHSGQSPSRPAAYRKPGPTGGKLIRAVIKLLRDEGLKLPLTSDILIAVSGGIDSIALAHLLIHYGRKITNPSRISLLHVNHCWRGAESDEDARFVRRNARKWGVKAKINKLRPLKADNKSSLEELARIARKQFFARETEKCGPRGAFVLTAHHADDLAETLLWRLFSGTADTHGGGIAVRYGNELRPLLGIRKAMLQRYLLEEGLSWREDRTNHEGRFLRSKLRLEVMPAVERLFPRAVDHLVREALKAQRNAKIRSSLGSSSDVEPLSHLFGAAGLKVRRPHWDLLLGKSANWVGEVHLPDGWRLIREKRQQADRWTLEKVNVGKRDENPSF